MVKEWAKRLADRYGGFPSSYMCLDLETSGPDAASDLILNIGHVIVEDGEVVSRADAFLDWTRGDLVEAEWLADRMAYTRYQMREKGKTYQMHYETLREKGEPPVEVLKAYLGLLRAQQEAGYAFVMHNGYNFDAPRLCNHFQRWLGETFDFGDWGIVDTGMFCKASQLNAVPDRSDTLASWSRRVGGVRAKGIYWALDGFALQAYDLVRKYNLNPEEAHGAGYDSYATHCLYNELRLLAGK